MTAKKGASMDNLSDCDKLAARFEKMAADGLRDVKFFVRSSDEMTAKTLCREANLLYEAVERGEEEKLDFRDSSH
jgi:hypothetical protein